MGTKLYVGNLSYSATDDQLGELFSQAGAVVSANVITDRQTGRPRGFAFVEMASAEDA
ncbi:RNA-binding protein, partial [Patescibacteria group bacterium]|nr:RNA-binding protein [Patescibacteria group bacterium]